MQTLNSKLCVRLESREFHDMATLKNNGLKVPA